MALAAFPVVDRNNAAAFWAGIGFFLPFHEKGDAIFFYGSAVCYKACSIPGSVAFLKGLDSFTWVIYAFIAVGKPLFPNTVFYPAFPAMFRFPCIAFQAAFTRLFMIAMPVAYHAVHSAWGKHTGFNGFCRHFHWDTPCTAIGNRTSTWAWSLKLYWMDPSVFTENGRLFSMAFSLSKERILKMER